MSRRIMITVDDMHALAKSKGGKCLSKSYLNSKSKLKWQCKKGHIWQAIPSHIIKGSWCSTCAGKIKKTLDDMHALAKSKGGKCLSEKYINNITKLKWQCDKGHIWETTPSTILQGGWCPSCAGVKKRTIDDMHALAKSKGGKCLSKSYLNSKSKLKWQCRNGHIWYAVPANIINGTWCPMCNAYVSEEICRLTFQKIFNQKFIKVRPDWLRTDKGNVLELDGYCEKLNIAFEYNGIQHYEKVRWSYSQSKEDIDKLLIRHKSYDAIKKSICKQKGITLIIISYLDNLENLQSLIKEQCEKNNYNLDGINFNQSFDIDTIDLTSSTLNFFKDLAKSKGGKCLSKKYINNATKLKWQCDKGHIWETTPGNIMKGTWCRKCHNLTKSLTIKELQVLAKSKGGKCLSTETDTNTSKLKWQCEKGHIWETTPAIIKQGSWCPRCASNRKSIDDMHALAKSKGGKCLSKKYINTVTKLKWQCKKGHIWETKPCVIKKGSWCPTCSRQK